MSDKNVFYFNCDSCGDYLMMSNLPELFYKKNKLYSYFSKKSEFKNNQCFDLIFAQNKYFKGFTDDEENIFVDCREPEKNLFQPFIYYKKLGFDNYNELPKIYYKPKKIKKYKNGILYDLASRALRDHIPHIKKSVNDTLDDLLNINRNYKVYVLDYQENKDDSIIRELPNKDFEYIKINNLFDYCDVLNSVGYYLGINSGSSLIASSIKEQYNNKLEIFYWTPDFDGGNWNPPNVNLIYYYI